MRRESSKGFWGLETVPSVVKLLFNNKIIVAWDTNIRVAKLNVFLSASNSPNNLSRFLSDQIIFCIALQISSGDQRGTKDMGGEKHYDYDYNIKILNNKQEEQRT